MGRKKVIMDMVLIFYMFYLPTCPFKRGILYTTNICDKVDGFLLVTSVSSTNKTDCHDITEILLKVALNTIKQTI